MKFSIKKLIKLFLFTTIALLATRLVAMESVPQQIPVSMINWLYWKDMLLNRPREALALARETKQEYFKILEQPDCFQRAGLWFLFYFIQCPFFMLDECAGGECLLRRSGGYREPFEKEISKQFVNVINSYRKVGYLGSFYYLGFGSGDLFLDFLILVRTLHARPNVSIVMKAYDVCYENNPEIQLLVKQMQTCIKEMFPQASLTLDLVDNSSMEALGVIENFQQRPDIIVAADLDKASRLKYQKLVAEALMIVDDSWVPNFLLVPVGLTKELAQGLVLFSKMEEKKLVDRKIPLRQEKE